GEQASGIQIETNVARALEKATPPGEHQAPSAEHLQEQSVRLDQLVAKLEPRSLEVRMIVIAVAAHEGIDTDTREGPTTLVSTEAEASPDPPNAAEGPFEPAIAPAETGRDRATRRSAHGVHRHVGVDAYGELRGLELASGSVHIPPANPQVQRRIGDDVRGNALPVRVLFAARLVAHGELRPRRSARPDLGSAGVA